MQLIVSFDEHHGIEIRCPGCDVFLTTVKEQDNRVHVMYHPPAKCRWSGQTFRVDRQSGYAEPWPDVREEAPCPPTADVTRTSTVSSALTPCTTFRSVTPHTPLDTPAGVRGRIVRFRGRG